MTASFHRFLGLTAITTFAASPLWITTSSASEGENDIEESVGVVALAGSESSEAPEVELLDLRPVNVRLQDAIYRTRLNPEALAAAGVTAAQTESVCNAVRAAMVELDPLLEEADSNCGLAKEALTRLRSLVRSGRGTDEDVAALAQAKLDHETALWARSQILEQIHGAGRAVLTESQATALLNIRRNYDRKAPMCMKVVSRTQEEWDRLEECLDAEKADTRAGREVPEIVVSLLSTARSDTNVAASDSNFGANLAAVQAAYSSSIRD